jgi:hypothetical protein
MKFSNLWRTLTEQMNKINGVSTPLGGISWVSTESERIIARRVIAFLEDKRALSIRFIPIPDRMMVGTIRNDYCVESVLNIRKFLTDQLGELDEKSPLAIDIRNVRDACRKFLDITSSMKFETGMPFGYDSHLIDSIAFNRALMDLKVVAGKHLLNISERFEIKIQGDLSFFINPEIDKTSLIKELTE